MNEFWNSVLFTQKLITVLGENTYPSKPTGYVGKYKNSWGKEEGTYYDWETDTYTNKKPVSVNTGTSLKEKEEEDYDYYYIRDIAYMMGSECLLDESEEILQEAQVEFNTYYEQDGLPPLLLWEFKSKLKGYYKAVF